MFSLITRPDTDPIVNDCADTSTPPRWMHPVWWVLTAALAIAIPASLHDHALTTRIIIAADLAALAGLLINWAIRRVATPIHAHCDQCGRCSITAGIPAAHTNQICDQRLKAAGWHLGDHGATTCPTCQ